MAVKEKLVKLISQEVVPYFAERIADLLIANGVTVQEWISVADRLPGVGECVLTLDKWGHIHDRTLYKFESGGVYFRPDGLSPGKDITHWMAMPDKPKDV